MIAAVNFWYYKVTSAMVVTAYSRMLCSFHHSVVRLFSDDEIPVDNSVDSTGFCLCLGSCHS
jgi:hypothetical protein